MKYSEQSRFRYSITATGRRGTLVRQVFSALFAAKN
jgi:hypothetical protein